MSFIYIKKIEIEINPRNTLREITKRYLLISEQNFIFIIYLLIYIYYIYIFICYILIRLFANKLGGSLKLPFRICSIFGISEL